MFRRLVIGVDGTVASRAALDLAGRLLRRRAEILLVHVTDTTTRGTGAAALDPGAAGTPADASGFPGAARDAEPGDGTERPDGPDDPTAILAEARRLAAPWGDVTTVVSRSADAARELHRIAARADADLIVVASGRHLGAGHVRLGTQAEAVVHGAPCAVAVAAQPGPRALRHVGVAFDGTDGGRGMVRRAGRIARETGADLTVLRVVDAPAAGAADARGLPRHEVEGLARAVAEVAGVPRIWRQLHRGDPVHEVVGLARSSDLLVVGTRSHGPRPGRPLGRVSAAAVRRAACDVLVVPAGDAARTVVPA